MALFNISGNANLSPNDFSSSNNDGGVLQNVGSSNSRFTSRELGAQKTVLGGSVVASGAAVNAVNEAAYLAGRFADMAKGEWVIAGITSTLAGQTNSVLGSPAGDFENRRKFNKIETVDSLEVTDGLRKGKFNHVTGDWDSGFPVDNTSGAWNARNDAAATANTDTAARTGWGSDTGALHYMNGSVTPTSGVYNAKNG